MQLYIENILAIEAKARASGKGTGRPVPLAIMTSDDTHAATQRLLAEHDHFGASPDQIHLLKQEKVGGDGVLIARARRGCCLTLLVLTHADLTCQGMMSCCHDVLARPPRLQWRRLDLMPAAATLAGALSVRRRCQAGAGPEGPLPAADQAARPRRRARAAALHRPRRHLGRAGVVPVHLGRPAAVERSRTVQHCLRRHTSSCTLEPLMMLPPNTSCRTTLAAHMASRS